MSILETANINNVETDEYYKLVGQIYSQLKNLERTTKHYSLNDTHYFIQLAQKCFENEIAKELKIDQ